MNILNWLSEKWKQYRLNHHRCESNLIFVESYKIRYTNEKSSIESVNCVYKCKICGKLIDK
jgi:hypothetical protein